MLGADIKKEFIGIIKKEMIPEYKKVIEAKEIIREKVIKYIKDTYMTPEDLDIISRYPDQIIWSESVSISRCRYEIAGIRVTPGYNSYSFYTYEDFENFNIIKFGEKLPFVCNNIDNFAMLNPDFKNIIWSDLEDLANNFKVCINKLVIAEKFLNHPKVNITFIKNNYEELYNRYKKNGADKRSEV